MTTSYDHVIIAGVAAISALAEIRRASDAPLDPKALARVEEHRQDLIEMANALPSDLTPFANLVIDAAAGLEVMHAVLDLRQQTLTHAWASVAGVEITPARGLH